MSRHLPRLFAASLTFAVGVAISPVRFTLEVTGHGSVKDGGGAYAVARYRSSYFVRLWRSSEVYDSPEKAEEVFRHRLEGAVRVLERGTKSDGEGAVVGERAVAVFRDPELKKGRAVVVWTEGRVLVEVSSPSLMHVLDFERRREDY